MNDMEEQLRQLEGEYSDSEDDYSEEEEEYDELMEQVLKENTEDQSVLSGDDSLSEEVEEDLFNKAPSKKKKKKKKKVIQNNESDTHANKNAEGEPNDNIETVGDQPNIDNPESLELDVSESKKSSKKQKKKNRKVETVKTDSDGEEQKFQLNNDSSGDEAFKSGKKSKGKKKQKNAKDTKVAPKGKAEAVDPPAEEENACACPEIVEDEEDELESEDLGKSKKKAKNKKGKSKSAVIENDDELAKAKGDLTCAQCR